MAVGPAGKDTNVSPQNYGGAPPKQEQVGEFKEALNQATASNDASGTQSSKGTEHSQDTSKSFPIILANRPPINLGNQIGQQGAPSQAGAAAAAAKKAPAATTQTASAQSAPPSGKPKMLFLPGMESRYNQGGVKKTPAEIDASAQHLAERLGMEAVICPFNSDVDQRAKQEAWAREQIKKGGVSTVYGFSGGGYVADHIQAQNPNLKYIKVGAPGTKGDIEPPTKHMEMPDWIAENYNEPSPPGSSDPHPLKHHVTEQQ